MTKGSTSTDESRAPKIELGERHGGRGSPPSGLDPSGFVLGPRARAAISAIRKSREERGLTAAPLPADAEGRLEQAIQLDLDLERRSRGAPAGAATFSFGAQAQVEIALQRLSKLENALLLRAICDDLARTRARAESRP
jgi:hypothetical protein